jgi:hypothetical protein
MPAEYPQERILTEITAWLHEVVLGLDLCPFARKPMESGQVRISVSTARDEGEVLAHLLAELQHLDRVEASETDTTLLVIPDCLEEFAHFNQFLDLADALLEDAGYTGDYQLATFHPHYQFAGTEAEDAANLTNCSPYPILHLLREASVEIALSAYPDPEDIPTRNVRRMEALSAAQRRQLFPYLRSL